MHAILLAAGRGKFISGHEAGDRPACLLQFGGRSLLSRHLDQLAQRGILKADLVVGYEARQVIDHIATLRSRPDVAFHFNPRFELGSALSLLAAAETLRTVGEALVLDTAAVYHPEILRRLVDSRQENCLLYDGSAGAGKNAIPITLHGGRVADFGRPVGDTPKGEPSGAMPGLFRVGPVAAGCIADACERYEREGLADTPYEEALRSLLHSCPLAFGFEDISGLAWSVLEDEDDLARAQSVLPAIQSQVPDF